MSLVEEAILNCSVFLYADEANAAAGTRWGGSGFLVGVPCDAETVYLYVVTNDHIIQGGNRVARLWHPKDGRFEMRDGGTEWNSHLAGDDIAALFLGRFPIDDYCYVRLDQLLTEGELDGDGPGPGDDCFMVGRFTRRTGQAFNRPVLRFGNLAMLPEPVVQVERALYNQESFLVDMRSISGFSGSPVFTYFTQTLPSSGIAFGLHVSQSSQRAVMGRLWLLGVDWGHLPVPVDVQDMNGFKSGTMQAPTGMAAVVPAWKLRELLSDP